MIKVIIDTWQAYNEFCDYLEEDKPDVFFIAETVIVGEYDVVTTPEFSHLIDDLKQQFLKIEFNLPKPTKVLTVEGISVNLY